MLTSAKVQKSFELRTVVRKKIKIWPKSLEDKRKMPISEINLEDTGKLNEMCK